MTEGSEDSGQRTLRIAIAGIHIESSTFSPHRSTLDDFTVEVGQELLDRYEWVMEPAPWTAGVEWVALLHAGALPGGPMVREDYDAIKQRILGLAGEAGQLDGLLFDIHGAMSVVGTDDAEGDLGQALREVIGPDVMVSASMDLHGNPTPKLLAAVDLITCYRMAPHEDARQSRARAARNLVDRLHSGVRPAKAYVTIPVLLPGEMTSTRLEPAKSIYAQVPEVEAMDGVLDAAIWVGYAWADEPRCKASVVVTGDDRGVVVREAERLARSYWEGRSDFRFVAPADTLEECVDRALRSSARPFFISDSGDNPTAGGAGDVTYTLTRLLSDPRITADQLTTIFASVRDADAVAAAKRAGVGNPVTLTAGAKVDHTAPPARITGVVHAIRERDGRGGDIAVVRVGGLHVILTTNRKQFHEISSYEALSLDPHRADLVVVKIGYLEPELYDAAADWLLALTPGGVDQHLLRLGHHRIDRPMWPFDRDDYEPSLTATLL